MAFEDTAGCFFRLSFYNMLNHIVLPVSILMFIEQN